MAAESAEPEGGAAGRRGAVARRKAKEAAVGAVARVLFYPTLLYNVVRSKVQAEFRWWDEVDQFILLGAVPFRRDVPRLQKLGVCGVITLRGRLVAWFLPSQALQMQVSVVWLPASRSEPSSPDAKGSSEPGSRDTDFICVFGEPGSHDAAQATKRCLFSARLYTYKQPNSNSLHLYNLSYEDLVPRCEPGSTHQRTKRSLNEPFETLVPSSMYQSRGIEHLVIPTRDYMFAPSLVEISQAVDFIHRNVSCGRMTYIHCKAGRGRSTTIVLCYLVKYKNMTPTTAFEYVRSRRARVLLTRLQWRVVQEFSKRNAELPSVTSHSAAASPAGDAVLVTEADLEGSDVTEIIQDASLSSHKTTPSRPMIKMLSCLFPSLKGSGDPSLTGHRVSEVDAC